MLKFGAILKLNIPVVYLNYECTLICPFLPLKRWKTKHWLYLLWFLLVWLHPYLRSLIIVKSFSCDLLMECFQIVWRVCPNLRDFKFFDFIEFSRMCPQNFYTKSWGERGLDWVIIQNKKTQICIEPPPHKENCYN